MVISVRLWHVATVLYCMDVVVLRRYIHVCNSDVFISSVYRPFSDRVHSTEVLMKSIGSELL